MDENSLIQKQKIMSIIVFVACAFFVLTFAIEKSKVILRMLPMAKASVTVSKKSDFVIKTTKRGYQIVVKKKSTDLNRRADFHKVVSSFYKKNNVVIEVGSNYGYNTVPLAENLKSSGKIYIFEPDNTICRALKKTIELNNIENSVFLKNIAISDHKGTCKIPNDYNNNSVVCNTLDDEMSAEKRPVDLITIDVPGMEMQILKSCKNIIKRSPDIIIATTFDNLESNEDKTILLALSNLGMNFYVSTGKNKFSQITVDKILEEQDEIVLIITRRKLNWLFRFLWLFKLLNIF